MATMTSAHLTIASGCSQGSVVVSLHGALNVPAAASLRRVLDGMVADGVARTITVDLHDVRGVDHAGIASLAEAVDQADQHGADVELTDPPELLCEALQSHGLTGRIRMGQLGRRALWPVTRVDRGQARRSHPAGHFLAHGGGEGADNRL